MHLLSYICNRYAWQKLIALILPVLCLLHISGCYSSSSNDSDAGASDASSDENKYADGSSDSDTDGDSDTDIDGDGDGDTDTDNDNDADADADLPDAGNLIWVKQAGGIGLEDSLSITMNSDNYIYITGGYSSISTFGKNEPNETILDLYGEGNTDIFIARYNSDGTLEWAKRAGGTGRDRGNCIATATDGSVFVTGFFQETAIFGEGEQNETSLIPKGGDADIFIAKYNPYGLLEWARSAGGSHSDRGNGITVITNSAVLVTGELWDTAVFGQGEPAETSLPSGLFVAKYDVDGNLIWARGNTEESQAWARDIAVMNDGSFYLTGNYGIVAFGNNGQTETEFSSSGLEDEDIFIARYNADGSFLWAKKAGGTADAIFGGPEESGNSVAVLSDGSALVTGKFVGPSTFGEGEPEEVTLNEGSHSFWAKYRSDGKLEWVRSTYGIDWASAVGKGITVLPDKSFLVTGGFDGKVIWGKDEPNERALTSGGHLDIYFSKLNSDGTLQWVKSAGAAYSLGSDSGNDIISLSNGVFLITGHFVDTAIFGKNEINETSIISEGDWDIFIAKYSP